MTVDPLILPVDAEALVSRFLRDQPEITTIVADRVYTDLPHEREYPLILLSRSGGGPIYNQRYQWLDQPQLLIECQATSHKQAVTMAGTVCAALIQRLVGRHPEGAVTRIEAVESSYSPDLPATDLTGHARPRVLVTVEITTHP